MGQAEQLEFLAQLLRQHNIKAERISWSSFGQHGTLFVTVKHDVMPVVCPDYREGIYDHGRAVERVYQFETYNVRFHSTHLPKPNMER
jgi:hypothetical protein